MSRLGWTSVTSGVTILPNRCCFRTSELPVSDNFLPVCGGTPCDMCCGQIIGPTAKVSLRCPFTSHRSIKNIANRHCGRFGFCCWPRKGQNKTASCCKPVVKHRSCVKVGAKQVSACHRKENTKLFYERLVNRQRHTHLPLSKPVNQGRKPCATF